VKYVGSKRRFKKRLLPLMLKALTPSRAWVEPFVGGGNMIDGVPPNFRRIGADINPHSIKALEIIRDKAHLLPKNSTEFTREDYNKMKKSDDYEFKSLAGFVYSFGSKWMASWAANKKGSDFVRQAFNSANKQSPFLQGVELVKSDYINLDIPENSVIYCDPPYKGTLNYGFDFDHDTFFHWARRMSKKGHTVFLSEYNAPKDFILINSIPLKDKGMHNHSNATKFKNHKECENLYTLDKTFELL
jgi:DNA adenine methylase